MELVDWFHGHYKFKSYLNNFFLQIYIYIYGVSNYSSISFISHDCSEDSFNDFIVAEVGGETMTKNLKMGE